MSGSRDRFRVSPVLEGSPATRMLPKQMPETVFVDFEASSLSKASYPIEVAWVTGNGEEESYLIRPAPGWTDWAETAERIHGISRKCLAMEGTPHEIVAARMVARLTSHLLYATAPSWDGKWLSWLLRAAGLPRHALRLADTEEAHHRVVRERLEATAVPKPDQARLRSAVLADAARQLDMSGTAAHRALPDAQAERTRWLAIARHAEEVAQRPPG